MTRPAASAIVTIALAIASTSTVSAQPTDQPEATGAPRPQSSLDITVDLFGAVDRALGSDAEAVVGSNERTYWGGNSQLTYEKSSGRYTFGAGANASVRRLTGATSDLLPSYAGSLHVAGPITRRTSWDLQQSFAYGPTNAVPFFTPGDLTAGMQPTLPLVDYRLTNEDQFASSTRGTFAYSVSRRGSLSAYAGYDRAGAPAASDETGTGAFQRWDVGASYSRQVTRYLNWYAGYGLAENVVNEATVLVTSPRVHNIDAGVAYGRPLSFSRRTRVSMQLGSTVIQARASGTRQWRANGHFSLRHEIGRTWQAQLGYNRDTQYVPGFADPLLNDAVAISVGGNLTQKSSASLVTNYAMGKVGIASTGANNYNLASVSGTYRYAFLTQLAAYVEYFLFDADFDRDVALSDTLVDGSRRHGLRVGVSIGTGLWGNRRRALATRTGEGTQ